MAVEMCICYNVSFKELKEISDNNKIKDIEKLRNKEEFGTSCGMCNDYVELMLKTGKTSFDVL